MHPGNGPPVMHNKKDIGLLHSGGGCCIHHQQSEVGVLGPAGQVLEISEWFTDLMLL